MPRTRLSDDLRPEESPIAWFGEMLLAIDRGDWSRAAKAQRELNRLGWSVDRRRKARRSPTSHLRRPPEGGWTMLLAPSASPPWMALALSDWPMSSARPKIRAPRPKVARPCPPVSPPDPKGVPPAVERCPPASSRHLASMTWPRSSPVPAGWLNACDPPARFPSLTSTSAAVQGGG